MINLELISKILTSFIPVKKLRREIRNKLFMFLSSCIIPKVKRKLLIKIKNKFKAYKKLKVAFYVVFDSVFQYESLYFKMLNDKNFEPYIVVIPDVSRGEKNMFYQMDKTYNSFILKYKNVFKSYSDTENKFIDFSADADLIFFANPYDRMTHKFYGVEYSFDKALCYYMGYYYFGKFSYDNLFLKSVCLDRFSKIFVENENSKQMLIENNVMSDIVISGYSKMDNISSISIKPRNRLKLIICPHHSVRRIPGYINISNFLRFSEFFLELPKIYPDIDFVFRPHPVLFSTLSANDLWGEAKVNEYIEKINNISNLEYQAGGEYFDLFVNSDGMIHDCGSFMAEYLYTEHPQCFILESAELLEQEFLPFGKKILDNIYSAYSKEDIIKFIDNIIVDNNDYMKTQRLKFADEFIKINYLHSTQIVFDNIKKDLVGGI